MCIYFLIFIGNNNKNIDDSRKFSLIDGFVLNWTEPGSEVKGCVNQTFYIQTIFNGKCMCIYIYLVKLNCTIYSPKYN